MIGRLTPLQAKWMCLNCFPFVPILSFIEAGEVLFLQQREFSLGAQGDMVKSIISDLVSIKVEKLSEMGKHLKRPVQGWPPTGHH
jgi:hypothetical protein